MIDTLLILLAAAQSVAPAEEVEPDCAYDLEAMLELSREEFDQTLPDGGWRELYERGCYAEAAELIHEWRHEKRDHASILYTHEGQLRAYAGQTDAAIALLKLTYKPLDEDANFGWNHYMDGTIAFLERDREGLMTAMERLKAIPARDAQIVDIHGNPVEIAWPPNLDVLEAFERCWKNSFAEAYGSEVCRNRED